MKFFIGMEVLDIAQLIKLRDYISRYEWNPYHYPSQYIKLKKDNWNKLYNIWNNQNDEKLLETTDLKEISTFAKLKSFIKQDGSEEEVQTEHTLPESEIELKHYFLDNLFPLQLKWATSTVKDVSYFDSKYHNDQTLKFFLQRFPDIYFLMYNPIFNIKQAPVDGEIVLISPIGIEIISMLESDEGTRYLAGDERTWIKDSVYKETNIMSPLIGLKRTEHIIKSILSAEELTYPIQKIILSRKNNIVFSSEPYNTSIIGKYQFEEWFAKKRKLKSTLKSQQIKVIESLLKYCLTTATKRPEWEKDTGVF